MNSDQKAAKAVLDMFLRATLLDSIGNSKDCEKKIIQIINTQAKNRSSVFKEITQLSDMPEAFGLNEGDGFKIYEKLFEIGFSSDGYKISLITKGILPFLNNLVLTADPFLHVFAHFGHAMDIFTENEFDFICGQLLTTPLESPRKPCKLLGSYLLAVHKLPKSKLNLAEYERLTKMAKSLNQEKSADRPLKAENFIKELINKYVEC